MPVDRATLQHLLAWFARTLITDYDIPSTLDRLAEDARVALGVTAAGVMILDRDDHLRYAAATDEIAKEAGLVQSAEGEGPCWECTRSGEVMCSEDLGVDRRWPAFARAATQGGLRAVCAFPMARDSKSYGSLTAFDRDPVAFDEEVLETGKLLADVTTAFLINVQHHGRVVELGEQLQEALSGRVLIEQAKGRLATLRGITPEAAFEEMRSKARHERRKLRALAEEIMQNPRSPG